MADLNSRALKSPEWSIIDTDTNATVTATKSAVAHKQHMITRVVVSFSAVVAAAATISVKRGTTDLELVNVGVLTTEPIILDYGNRPLVGDIDEAVSVVVTAGGSNVIGTVVMQGLSFSGNTSTMTPTKTS